MTDCLFCKIIKGEIPCIKVYEDEKTIAFLDIMPTVEGHCLVLPKKHEETILKSSPEDIKAVFETIKTISPAIMKATNSQGLNLNININKQAGQAVMHTHVHLIPRKDNDGLKLWPQDKNYPKDKLEATAVKIKEYI